jgi:Na+/H+-dicarboxylate symporter
MSLGLGGRPRSFSHLAANPWLMLGSVAAGVAVGHLTPALAIQMGILGEIYMDLLKMVVLPFMLAVVIFSLRKLLADPQNVDILPRILLTFLGAFALAALAGLVAGVLLGPGQNLSPEHLLAMGKLAGTEALGGHHDAFALFGTDVASKPQTLSELALSLIPINIFAALSQGETLKVLAFSLLFGLAVGKSTGRVAETLTEVLETIYHACLTLTGWFNLLLPLVLFTFVASQTAKTGLEPMRAMIKFIVTLTLGSLGAVGLSLWVLRLVSRRPWRVVLRSQHDPLLMALITREPQACMPTMITGLVETLGFTRSRIELLVPLGVSLVQLGTVFYTVLGTIFIAQLYGVQLNLMQMGGVMVGSMLAGLASSGMSHVVAISLTGLVCNYLRLPFEAALTLFMAVDPVCEIMVTVVGVVGNSAFAATAAGSEPSASLQLEASLPASQP